MNRRQEYDFRKARRESMTPAAGRLLAQINALDAREVVTRLPLLERIAFALGALRG